VSSHRFLATLLPVLLMITGCRPPSAPRALTPDERFRRFLASGRTLGPLSPETLSDTTSGGLRVRRIAFAPEAGERAVAVLMSPARPAAPKLPVIVLQHWLGGTKDSAPLVRVQETLANTGALVVAIDARFRGERRRGTDLQDAMIRAYRTGKGHPWLIDTAFDLTRLTDLLVTLPETDPERIAAVGLSEGGFEVWMAAVADKRISVIVPVIGVTRLDPMADTLSRHWMFERVFRAVARDLGETTVTPRVAHALWDRLLPDYAATLDPIHLMPTLAPRPLLILAHENDEIVPLKGAKEVYAAVEKAYKAEGATDRLKFQVQPGMGHEDQSMTEWLDVLAFLNRWLRLEEPEK
jgi:dienelactone hydrolase